MNAKSTNSKETSVLFFVLKRFSIPIDLIMTRKSYLSASVLSNSLFIRRPFSMMDGTILPKKEVEMEDKRRKLKQPIPMFL